MDRSSGNVDRINTKCDHQLYAVTNNTRESHIIKRIRATHIASETFRIFEGSVERINQNLSWPCGYMRVCVFSVCVYCLYVKMCGDRVP